jgi:hypothetical protein
MWKKDTRELPWRFALLIFCSLLLGLTALRCARQPTTFINLQPDVAYTGDLSCEPCHKKIYASYRETGMGRSLYRPDTSEIIERFGQEVVVFDRFSGYFYQPYFQGNDFYMLEFKLKGEDTVYQRREKIDYIVGSGHQTRSYLLERNGYLYEAPITWYVSKQLWDLSPGYDEGQNSRFNREIGLECLACHTGDFEYIEGSKHRYREISLGIDCERCHGPGEAHIKAIEGGQLIDVGEETDYTIVNPAKLPINKRFDVCQQCHLQGINVLKDGKDVRDFRPGMDLTDVYHVFLEPPADPDAFGIASHAERLQQSACFLNSEGKLNCTTCHDPHKSIAVTDKQVYIRQCQGCHQPNKEPECSSSEDAQMLEGGNCISCHMPKGGTSDIPHVSFHDHKIRIISPADTAARDLQAEKKFVQELVCATTDSAPGHVWGKAWLSKFERDLPRTTYLHKAARHLPKQGHEYARARLALYQGQLAQARSLCQAALSATPEDPFLLYLQGEIEEAEGKYEAAFQAFDAAYQQNGEAFEAGFKAAVNLLRARAGQQEVLGEARQRFERLLEQKPFEARLLSNLGFVAMNQRQFRQAEQYLAKALRFEPGYAQALENMVYLQLARGNRARARIYFERLVEAEPDYPGIQALKRQGVTSYELRM